MKLFALIPLILLTACAGGVSSDTQSFCLVLPVIKNYSQQDMDAVANEVEANQSPMQTELIKDYKVIRDETRIAKERLCHDN